MGLLGKGKPDGSVDVRRGGSRSSSMPTQYRSTPVEPSGLGDALERKWEEAWRRARAADYNTK